MKHIDLFTGIGGFSLACQWNGIETEVMCEKNPFCQKVLNKNFPNVPIISNIEDFNGTKYKKTYLLTGGPPCQKTSVAAAISGNRTGETLWPAMERIIEENHPEWIIIEQPPGNKGWENQVEVSLEALNYYYTKFEQSAVFCGAPHQRRRVFFIANSVRERLDTFARLRKSSPIIEKSWPPPPRGTWRSSRTGDCRMDDGIPYWVDRIKALGNSIVPQVAHEIIKAIVITDKLYEG